jgi:hypothetical protein
MTLALAMGSLFAAIHNAQRLALVLLLLAALTQHAR